MVNTELISVTVCINIYYNILNIVVNTEPHYNTQLGEPDYNILNIVVNTELYEYGNDIFENYNILNIVVNTELAYDFIYFWNIITY